MEENRPLIIWSEKAKTDFSSILEFIHLNESRERALYVLKGIEKTISQIFPFPYKFGKETKFNNPNIRYAIKWRYKIIYEISDNYIEILRIFHTSQDPSKLI